MKGLECKSECMNYSDLEVCDLHASRNLASYVACHISIYSNNGRLGDVFWENGATEIRSRRGKKNVVVV